MILREAARTALREIRLHKFRSALSFFAFAIGAASILYTFAQTHAMRKATMTAIELQGPGRLLIGAKRNYRSRGLSQGLTVGDADEIRRSISGLYMAYPKNNSWKTLHFGRTKVDDVSVFGITPEWRKRDWVFRLRGRFLNDWDVANAERVCIVVEPGGWYKKPPWAVFWKDSTYEKFAARHDLLGKHLRLQDHDFLVVGTLRQPPRDLDPRSRGSRDGNILVPVTTMNRYLRPGSWKSRPLDAVREIELDSGDEKTIPAVKSRIEAILKRRHRGEEDFDIVDSRDAIQNEINEMNKYVLTFTALGAIAIFSGGIGMMNVMLAAMFSRVKEIGIRRAIGAAQGDIMAQFVAEAAFVGLAGGVVGVALGKAGVSYFQQNAERSLVSITWYHLVGVVALSAAASSLFALYPALRAARLDPVDSLRNE